MTFYSTHYCMGFPCPYCLPNVITPVYTLPPQPFICAPAGCVCPPTSEKTCGNKYCPRKDPFAPKAIEKKPKKK